MLTPFKTKPSNESTCCISSLDVYLMIKGLLLFLDYSKGLRCFTSVSRYGVFVNCDQENSNQNRKHIQIHPCIRKLWIMDSLIASLDLPI
ncbi:hypothetical protein L1987_12488 [Smallanthus sonchifolius]|uniref:Uncharacterized protein n=1 Tax=Smallanthus sonchifolius TaxID=185202 RepID=A0ACB9JG88_9ASTR|nr:hypothetical protein L1987_12488 [Smallanthus sonchifolius]